MNIKIPEKLWDAMGGEDTFRHYGLSGFNTRRDWSWHKFITLDIATLTPDRLKRLEEQVKPHSKIRGVKVILADIATWRRVLARDPGMKPRSVEQFTDILKEHLRHVPGHRIYSKYGDVWLAYYVNEVRFHPEQERNGYRSPPYVSVGCMYEEMGHRHSENFSFFAEDCLHRTATEALEKKGWVVETPELREGYLASLKRYLEIDGRIGLQVLGTGLGTDNLDGNPEGNRWGFSNTNTIRLDHNGTPARLVVDVYFESDKEDRRGERPNLDLYFWERKRLLVDTAGDDGEDDSYDDLNDELDDEEDDGDIPDTGEDDEDDDTVESHKKVAKVLKVSEIVPDESKLTTPPKIEVPVHPMIPTFDLKRHLRMRVHVDSLEVYEYDTKLADKLVLPKDLISMIGILISGGGGFKDIVEGKSGGSIILCAGPAGVGKTLTAEVYSEATERPLYSVQCSQLGIEPAELETELHRIFNRAARWNAIALLDEADVYVMSRGNDLIQNAIVGVFLRVLEYFPGTLFMTTNRSEMVDDAIASRCIARIDYKLPSQDDQARLWRVLADTMGVSISDEVIADTMKAHPELSGRDIKNLLKLAASVSRSRGTSIDVETITFVKRFKPTVTLTAEPKARRAKD